MLWNLPPFLGNCFSGNIDEVRFYDKELSADEVSKNYTNGLGKHS